MCFSTGIKKRFNYLCIQFHGGKIYSNNWNNRYPKPIEDIFANAITTNGQELESMDLQIIFNFELFNKEGMKFLVEDEGDIICTFVKYWELISRFF